ncbi:MAG: type IV pili twitching motility protein PilT, partial [Bdellovibrionota bacterium]
QVYSSMQTGQAESGMQTMNQSLIKLVADGTITEEVAVESSTVPDELVRLITGLGNIKKR